MTPLNRYIGYEEAAKVAKKALERAQDDPRRSSSSAATSSDGELTEAQLDEALDVLGMTRPPA